MSLHIGAEKDEIADVVLLPGDPLRAKFIAENFLTDVICYNKVRNMLGFTGTYKGKRISVQGAGMGMGSTAIYVHELLNEYNVKTLVRVGTCGGLIADLKIGEIIPIQGLWLTDLQHKRQTSRLGHLSDWFEFDIQSVKMSTYLCYPILISN